MNRIPPKAKSAMRQSIQHLRSDASTDSDHPDEDRSLANKVEKVLKGKGNGKKRPH